MAETITQPALKTTISRQALTAALGIAGSAVIKTPRARTNKDGKTIPPRPSKFPQLEGRVRLDLAGDTLTVSSSNYELEIQVRIPAAEYAGAGGAVVLKLDALATAGQFKEDLLTVTQAPAGVTFKAGRLLTRCQYDAGDLTTYPRPAERHDIDTGKWAWVSAPAVDLARALAAVLPCSARSDAREALTAIHVTESADGVFSVEACDGYRAARVTVGGAAALNTREGAAVDWLIPRAAAEALLAAISASNAGHISGRAASDERAAIGVLSNPQRIAAIARDAQITAPAISSRYPPIGGFFQPREESAVRVNAGDLLAAVRAAGVLGADLGDPKPKVTIGWSGGALHVASSSTEYGFADVGIDGRLEGTAPEQPIRLDADMLRAALAPLPAGALVRLGMGKRGDAIRLSVAGGCDEMASWAYVQMPILGEVKGAK